MDFGANMRSKGDPKSRNLGDISRPLARGGQMGLQGLQNDAKMVQMGAKSGPRDPNWSHKGAKRSAKGGKRAPKRAQSEPKIN